MDPKFYILIDRPAVAMQRTAIYYLDGNTIRRWNFETGEDILWSTLPRDSEIAKFHQARMFNQDYRVLVEGVVDAMRGWEASLPAVGFIRNSASQGQMEILLKETRKVIYCMDGDEHGEFFKRSTAHRMFVVPFFSWGAVTLPSGKDPGALPPQQLQDLVGAVHESLW